MNDIVSIRKIRPLASVKTDVDAGATLGGGDFFLGGNQPSLSAKKFTDRCPKIAEKKVPSSVDPCVPPVSPVVKLLGSEIKLRRRTAAVTAKTQQSAYDMAFSVHGP